MKTLHDRYLQHQRMALHLVSLATTRQVGFEKPEEMLQVIMGGSNVSRLV
jgi:hypothetical protein